MKAGLALGAYAFAAGVLLGPVRELLLAPAIGGIGAAVTEALLLAIVLWFIAGYALRPAPAVPWAAALAAVGVVLAMEFGLGALFDWLGPAMQRVPRSLAEQAAGLLPLAWLGALPFLRRRG